MRVAIQAIASSKTHRRIGRFNDDGRAGIFGVCRVVAVHELVEEIVDDGLVSGIASDENADFFGGQKINAADRAHPVAVLPDDANSVWKLFPVGEGGAGEARVVCVLALEHALRGILGQYSLRAVLA